MMLELLRNLLGDQGGDPPRANGVGGGAERSVAAGGTHSVRSALCD
jgi:hypothetical protein